MIRWIPAKPLGRFDREEKDGRMQGAELIEYRQVLWRQRDVHIYLGEPAIDRGLLCRSRKGAAVKSLLETSPFWRRAIDWRLASSFLWLHVFCST